MIEKAKVTVSERLRSLIDADLDKKLTRRGIPSLRERVPVWSAIIINRLVKRRFKKSI